MKAEGACEDCRAVVANAVVIGERWADRVVNSLVHEHWPERWPVSPKAVAIAARLVGRVTSSPEQKGRIARVCLEAASRRYCELRDRLRRR